MNTYCIKYKDGHIAYVTANGTQLNNGVLTFYSRTGVQYREHRWVNLDTVSEIFQVEEVESND